MLSSLIKHDAKVRYKSNSDNHNLRNKYILKITGLFEKFWNAKFDVNSLIFLL